MDLLSCRILNALQDGFPLVHAPFLELGNQLGISGQECLLRVKKMKDDGLIREIGAVFDARRLGYQSTLVAMKIEPSRLREAAAVVNRHPGVSHNYERKDDFNLWFTLAVPSAEDLEAAVLGLHEAAGSLRTLNLPALKVYKIGVRFRFSEEGVKSVSEAGAGSPVKMAASPLPPEDVGFVRAFQEEFPLVLNPYRAIAEKNSIREEALFEKAREMREKGCLRRVGALIDHRKAGFTENILAVWQVPDESLDEVGRKLGAFPEVSHCYWRKITKEWPYPIYSMIHMCKVEEVCEIIYKMKSAVGECSCKIVPGLREFKKVRMRYFDDYPAKRL